MAKNNRLPEIAKERGEALNSLIPRLYAFYGDDEGVAEDLGVHPNTIIRWRKKNGYGRRLTVELVPTGVAHVAL